MLITILEDTDDDVEMDETSDDSASILSEPDPYDAVYSTIPEETHMLKPVEGCKHCHAKRFEREPPGFCCRGGKTKLANQDTMQRWSGWKNCGSTSCRRGTLLHAGSPEPRPWRNLLR